MKLYDKSRIEDEIQYVKDLIFEYENTHGESSEDGYLTNLYDRLNNLQDKLDFINEPKPSKQENRFKKNFLTGLRKLNITYLPDHDAEPGEDTYVILTSINRWKEYCFRWYERGFDIDYYIPTSDYQIRFRNITYSGKR